MASLGGRRDPDMEEIPLRDVDTSLHSPGCAGRMRGWWLGLSLFQRLGIIAAPVLLIICVTIIAVIIPIALMEDKNEHPCKAAAEKLINAAMDPRQNTAWQRLAFMTDTFGPRISGSSNLESAIDWMETELNQQSLEGVTKEPAYVPTWIRGQERATMRTPRPKNLAIMGLGGSIATPPEGITAKVLAVSNFSDLAAQAPSAVGKIVLFNVPFTTYGQTVVYRSTGAIEAAKVGAVACLVRSVTPYSLYTPHTGSMRYEDGVPKIPAAAITIEDAEMIVRMQSRGQEVEIQLYMEGHFLNDSLSYNIIAQINGSQTSQELVVMGGHIDSWDVGQGAMDDGGGVVVTWEAVRLMHVLGLRPRRTVRFVGWTNEENGLRGATAYRNAHLNETHVLAIESDSGTNAPVGLQFTGSASAMDILSDISDLLSGISANTLTTGGGGADISPLMQDGVPGANLYSTDHAQKYFWFHHTEADTMDKMDEGDMRKATAILAVYAYCVADLPQPLPRQ